MPCPAWRAGQIVIMDDLCVHKNAQVRAQIEAAGCRRGITRAFGVCRKTTLRWVGEKSGHSARLQRHAAAQQARVA